jgi:hypothetical protein
MIAFSAGGRSIAIWMLLNPEYEYPYMPTVPSDHGWVASQWITVAMSVRSTSGYSSVAAPSLDPVPRTSTRQST